jgi:hypothetical protein
VVARLVAEVAEVAVWVKAAEVAAALIYMDKVLVVPEALLPAVVVVEVVVEIKGIREVTFVVVH